MRLSLLLSASLLLGLAPAAHALSLPEAIDAARTYSPLMGEARAQRDAARARLVQARGAALPNVVISAEAGEGEADLGGFFGFQDSDMSPRAAAIELRQSLFAGGAIAGAIRQAGAGREMAAYRLDGAQAGLSLMVARAYAGVLTATEVRALHQAQVTQMEEIVRHARLRFEAGEIPRTDLAQAQARAAEARAGLAQASGGLEAARAGFFAIVGQEPEGLEEPAAPPAAAGSRDQAVEMALAQNQDLKAAEAAHRAARAGVAVARAERLPSLALVARASSMRDQFFPGYRSDGSTIGVQGRMTLFSSGAVSGRISEAQAQARAAEARLQGARDAVRAEAITAFEGHAAAVASLVAARERAEAAGLALETMRHEVRVGQRTTLELLDAEREALSARTALAHVRGEAVVAVYRLNAAVGAD